MPYIIPYLGYIATAATVVGAGVSAYSSYAAGKTSQMIANYNAANQEKNAKLQLMQMQTQANMQKQNAEAQFAMRQQEAQAKFNNATSIENQAEGQDRINRVNLEKRRGELERQQASTRAAIAASGAVESSGTPLDILAETAGIIQRDQEEQHYSDNLQRSQLYREASMERLGGQLALAGATLDQSSNVAAAGLNGVAARSTYLSNMRESTLTRLGGKAAASAGKINAGATLFTGIGTAAGYQQKFKAT
jgi:hypothetical protein